MCFSVATSLLLGASLLVGCGSTSSDAPPTSSGGGDPSQGLVRVVLFTHIEDNTPMGALGSTQSAAAYDKLRAAMVEVAKFAKARQIPWVVQPDWKYLESALLFEDATRTATTSGKNVFAYLREDLDVAIDPHSHENGGYNYADVAYLLDQLGVGGSTVIGGHIWDPSLPEFQEWDRFRAPLAGQKYPSFSWRGEILMGAGTPNHVNDPLVSGVWRPKDREHFFEDDPTGNIVAYGAWHDEVAGVEELVDLYASGGVAKSRLLTAYWNIVPAELTAAGGPANVDSTVFAPLAELRDAGKIEVTDFTTLTKRWRESLGAEPHVYQGGS